MPFALYSSHIWSLYQGQKSTNLCQNTAVKGFSVKRFGLNFLARHGREVSKSVCASENFLNVLHVGHPKDWSIFSVMATVALPVPLSTGITSASLLMRVNSGKPIAGPSSSPSSCKSSSFKADIYIYIQPPTPGLVACYVATQQNLLHLACNSQQWR